MSGNLSNRVNLVELAKNQDRPMVGRRLDLIQLGPNQTAFRLFTTDAERVRLHYLADGGITGYAQCTGEDCPLCQAGVKLEERVLLPVFDMMARQVRILSMSKSSTPGALYPQILTVVEQDRPVALLVNKPDRMTFRVATRDLGPGVYDGANEVKQFLQQWEAGAIDITSVYPRYDRRVLADLPAVAAMLSLKGLTSGSPPNGSTNLGTPASAGDDPDSRPGADGLKPSPNGGEGV